MAILKPILMPPQKKLLLSKSLNDPEWCFQVSRIESFRKCWEFQVLDRSLESVKVLCQLISAAGNTGLADIINNKLIAFVPL